MALSRREFVRRIGAGGAGVAAASGIIGYGREEELFAFVQGEDSAADGRQWAVRPDSSQQQRESEGPEPQGHRGVEGASLGGSRSWLSTAERSGFVEACAAMDGGKPNNIISTGSVKSSPPRSWPIATATSRSSLAIRHAARRPRPRSTSRRR